LNIVVLKNGEISGNISLYSFAFFESVIKLNNKKIKISGNPIVRNIIVGKKTIIIN
jgi:hypothetical protein